MKKTIVLAVAFLSAIIMAGAVEYRQLTPEEKKLIASDYQKLSDADKAKRQIAMELHTLHRNGGRMLMPGTPKGSIRIVNLQKKVSTEELKGIERSFTSLLPYDIKIVDVDCRASLKIVLVDDEVHSALSISPDEGLATVNVKKLVDAKTVESPAFLTARVRKEILRAFAYMTACSTYDAPLLYHMERPADLDECASGSFPMDVVMRSANYLRKMGVMPEERTTYRRVLMKGHDIAPTNEFQRVIYDEIKAKKKLGKAEK